MFINELFLLPRSSTQHRQAVPGPAGRQLSLDALRGFAMVWLIGAREFFLAVVAWLHPPWLDAWETQLTHPRWHGPVAWDLVMPVFLFVMGASMPFSLVMRTKHSPSLLSAYRRISFRVAVLWCLGIMLQTIKPDTKGLELYSNPLQAIAIGYLVTAMVLLHMRVRNQIGVLALLVLGYAAVLLFVPFPGQAAGMLERRLNLPHFIDVLVLGPFRRDHSFAWILPSLGFAATVLMGAMAGHLLRTPLTVSGRLLLLLTIGAASMTAGWLWSGWLPLNRYLWTSSLILWAGGISFWLMALFHVVIDIWKLRRWSFPLVVIGANALLAYVADPFFMRIGQAVVAAGVIEIASEGSAVLCALFEIAGLWLLLRLLYQRGICFRA